MSSRKSELIRGAHKQLIPTHEAGFFSIHGCLKTKFEGGKLTFSTQKTFDIRSIADFLDIHLVLLCVSEKITKFISSKNNRRGLFLRNRGVFEKKIFFRPVFFLLFYP